MLDTFNKFVSKYSNYKTNKHESHNYFSLFAHGWYKPGAAKKFGRVTPRLPFLSRFFFTKTVYMFPLLTGSLGELTAKERLLNSIRMERSLMHLG